jgi:hypothetical protein
MTARTRRRLTIIVGLLASLELMLGGAILFLWVLVR